MVNFIYTAREHHGVRSAQELLSKHAAFIARKAAKGGRWAVHEDAATLVGQVGGNSWMADCPYCNSGIALDPEFGVACCFGCGAVYRDIVMPNEKARAAIEATLLARPAMRTRSWLPTETVDVLVAENVEHGLPARKGGKS